MEAAPLWNYSIMPKSNFKVMHTGYDVGSNVKTTVGPGRSNTTQLG